MQDSRPITIGYDGSAFATAALRNGLGLAAKLGLPVRIVRAWTISNAPRPASWTAGFVPPVEDFAETVRQQVTEQIAPVVAEYPDVEIDIQVPHGAAGRELIRASRDSRLIVVGTRGLGGFSGLLIGSVSQQLVEHAACDVLVTRRPDGDQAPPRELQLDAVIETVS